MEGVTQKTRLVMVEPLQMLYERHECLTAAGVYHDKAGLSFKVMIANFRKQPVSLYANKTVAHCDENPTALAEYDISHAELFGIVEEDTKYRKRDDNDKDTNTIDKTATTKITTERREAPFLNVLYPSPRNSTTSGMRPATHRVSTPKR